LCQLDVSSRDASAVLANDVEQHEEIPRPPVEDAIEVAATVTSELAQAAIELRGFREWKRGMVIRHPVQLLDLAFDGDPGPPRKVREEEVLHGLSPSFISIEHRLRRHAPSRAGGRWFIPT
jgi:hypothetical protein